VGAVVAALAVAAHGLAGGGYPEATGLTLLLAAATAVGTLAATLPATGHAGRTALFALLTGGQWAGHEALTGLIGGHHGPTCAGHAVFAGLHLPGGLMAAAHTLAAVLCAVLITLADRLYAALSRAIRAVVTRPGPLPPVVRALRHPRSTNHLHGLLRSGVLGSRAPPMPV
jgi:hypothetical protein